MRQRIKPFVTAAFVVVGLLAWSIQALADSTSPCKARLSQAEAIVLANNAATHSGFALRDFRRPTARFRPDADAKSCSWSVFYNGKTPTLGNHFHVFVDDQTKRTMVLPGE